MADNDALDLAKLLNTSTQYQAAKYGGGGLLDMLLAGYQAAFPKAPAANLMMGMRQAHNVGQYNRAVQAQAALAQQRQAEMDANNAQIFNTRTGQDIQGPFSETLANSAAPDLRQDNAKSSLNTFLGGGALSLDTQADYDPALIRDYAGQQAKVANAMQAEPMGLSAIGSGQGASLIRQALNKQANAGMAPGSPLKDAILQNADGTAQLTTGIGQTAPQPASMNFNKSPFTFATDVPTGLAGLYKSGLDDAQAKGTLTETNRHNTITEGETKRHNVTQEGIGKTHAAAHMKSASRPTGGGGSQPSQSTVLSNIARQMNLTPAQEARMRLDPQNFFLEYAPGEGATPQGTPQPAKPTFGGNSKQNLDKASLSHAIYPGPKRPK